MLIYNNILTVIVVKTSENTTSFYNFRRKNCKNRVRSGHFLQFTCVGGKKGLVASIA
jgi:hypothetical protein